MPARSATNLFCLSTVALAVPFALFLLVYVPAAGHGFISDDFIWILFNRVRHAADLKGVVLGDNGFYRPIVALSFSANEYVFGLHPRPYGLTNVFLAALCGGSVYALCRSLEMRPGAAAFGAALWLLNLHGINMAILWISGRTALITTAAAAGCVAALLRGRDWLALALFGMAVFAREEAVLLAPVTAVWLYVLREENAFAGAFHWRSRLIGGAVIIIVYFTLRSGTHAMTPATAPSFYRFTPDAFTWLRNIAQYSDRTMTFSAGMLVLLALILRPHQWRLDARTWRVVAAGSAWLGVFVAPALILSVRSSLYACLPSAGVSVAAAAIASRWWLSASAARRRTALIAVIPLAAVLFPVYVARNQRWVKMAEFSTQALSDLQAAARSYPDDSNILIIDDRSARANVASVFSTMVRDCFLLVSGRYMTFYVDPPVSNADPLNGGAPVCTDCVDITLVVKNGRLQRQ